MFAVVQLASSNNESLPAIINYTVPFVFLSCQAETEDLTKEIQKLQWQLQDKEDVIKENQLLKQQLQEKEQQIREKDHIIKAQERPVKLPTGIRGSAAVEGNIAYFRMCETCGMSA